jgi:hypothetical protein
VKRSNNDQKQTHTFDDDDWFKPNVIGAVVQIVVVIGAAHHHSGFLNQAALALALATGLVHETTHKIFFYGAVK